MLKKLTIITSLFLLLSQYKLIYAVTPSPSATPTIVQEKQTNSNIKKRIEKILDEKKGEVEGIINNIQKSSRGFIGEITRVSEETITITTIKETKIIPINEDISLTKNNKPIDVQKLTVGDWIVVIGNLEDDNFVTKKIIVSTKTLKPKNKIILLGSIEKNSPSYVQVLPRNDSESKRLTITKNTEFLDNLGKPIKRIQLNEGINCLVVGFTTDKGYSATTIKTLAPISLER